MRAERFVGLNKDGKLEYHRLEIVEEITAERDRALKENGALKDRIGELHVIEVDFAKLSKSNWRERTFTAICTFAMMVGACLISAYPSGATGTLWWFTSTQLFAIGWAFVLIGGALQFFKAILGL